MTTAATYRRVLELSMPAPNTTARLEWLQAAMEVITDAIEEHAASKADALVGLSLLVEHHGTKRIADKLVNAGVSGITTAEFLDRKKT